MNAKRKLNCYFFSNLIVCFLSLNFIVNNNKVTLQVASSSENPTLVNVFKTEVLDTNSGLSNNVIELDTSTKISVSMKMVNSKNVLPYVKPSYNSVTGANLVNYARNYLGLPYVYAGDSLSTGTDCSGFTRLIYREFGISLGRTVGSQLYSGTYVSKNDLQPGDLVFYGYSSNNASHVAIYMGGGLIIHQSNPRSGVKIDSVNIMVYVTARRLITADVKIEEKEEPKVVETTQEPNNVPKENSKPLETESTDKVVPDKVKEETPKEKENQTLVTEPKKDDIVVNEKQPSDNVTNSDTTTENNGIVNETKEQTNNTEVKEEIKPSLPLEENKIQDNQVEVQEVEITEPISENITSNTLTEENK